MPRIGNMGKRITLQTMSVTAGASGASTVSYADVATVWASVTTVKGAERIGAVNAGEGPTHRFVVRFRDDIDAANVVLFDGRRFRIQDVENVDERGIFQDLLCEELREVS